MYIFSDGPKLELSNGVSHVLIAHFGTKLWTLKLDLKFSGIEYFEVRANYLTHSSMTINGLGRLLEIIPLLRKKFHGLTTSRTLSMVAEVKNY